MVIKTIVPKLCDGMYYLGKPVNDSNGVRIGSITDVKENGDQYELTMTMEFNIRVEIPDTVSYASSLLEMRGL